MSGGSQGLIGARLGWYLWRLRAMGPAEMLHRIREAALKRSGQRLMRPWRDFELAEPRLPELAGDLAMRMSNRLRPIVADEAQRVIDGRFSLLGREWPAPETWPPGDQFWRRQPGAAPEETKAAGGPPYAFDALRSAVAGRADLKRLWEINRLQFLLPLAMEARLAADPARAAAAHDLAFDLIFGWMDANPPFRGLGYSSGIELGLRAISVALAAGALGLERLPAARRRRLGAFFEAHRAWLERFPSLHSSANNHRVAELAGLVAAGACLGEDRERLARRRAALEASALAQFHPDGVGVEQAPSYAAFSVELTLVGHALSGAAAGEASPALRGRLADWLESVLWLMDEAGRLPSIGDDDGGRAVALGQEVEHRYVASVAHMLAGWLGRPDLAPPARDPHLRDLFFGELPPGAGAPPGSRSWPQGGWTVWRGEAPSFMLAFDHGPLGHFGIAAHGHADTLGLWLHVGGQPVLIDPGMPTYQGWDPARDALRGSQAHNTLSVAGRSSSLPAGAFNWRLQASGRLISRNGSDLVAAHDGYVGRCGVTHVRAVEAQADGSFRVVDSLRGKPGPHEVSIRWLVDPGCAVAADGPGAWVLRLPGGRAIRLRLEGPLPCRWVAPDDPAAAMIAEGYGLTRRAGYLSCDGQLRAGDAQTTHVVIGEPPSDGRPGRGRRASPDTNLHPPLDL